MDSKELKTEKGFGHPVVVVFWTLVIFIVSQFLALFIAEFFTLLLSSQPFSSTSLNNSAAGQFFYILMAEGFVIVSIYLLLRRQGKSLKDVGFGRWPRWKDLSWATAAFGIFVVSLIIITVIITGLWHGYDTNQLQDVGFKATTSGSDKLIAFFSLVFLPPLGEETLMRGYLYTGLRKRWSFVVAGLATSILFGAAHLLTGQSGLLWAAAVDTFVLSIFLVYLREKTGAIYAGMVLHGLNNVLAFLVYFHS